MAEEKEITISRHMRYMFNQFAKRIKSAPPWELVSETLENELKEVFGSDFENHYKIASSVVAFAKATGGLPKDKEERTELLQLIAPMLKSDAEAVVSLLQKFMYASRSMNAADVYSKGHVNPKLAAILNDRYEMTEELYNHHYGTTMRYSDLIPYLIREGKIDFTPFKSGADKEEDWYFDYRISVSPLPVPTGYPVLTLDRIKESASKEYISLVSELKDVAMRSLCGVKASGDLLKNVKNLKADQEGYIKQPIDPEIFLQFADAVEKQYQRRQKEHTRKDYAAPFNSPHEAGFYVNPVTCTIYDLRPYRKDLHTLFSIKSWRYLKDFVTALRDMVENFTGSEIAKKEFARAELYKADKINYPVDKVNNNLWGTIEGSNGQLAFSTVKTGKGKEVTIVAAINFVNIEGIQITKKLTNFDKRVYIAVSALWNAGNTVITLTQIHYAMGSTQRPAKYQLEKINEAVSKMTTAKLFLDNVNEVEKLKYKYKKFKYDGALLPMERMTATIKGQLSDAAIHIFREPPLMTFAKERNQITTFDVKLLQSPVSKTDGNLAIEDYLLERIAGAKQAASKGKKVIINTILYETLFQKVGITDRKQRTRAVDKIKKFLDYYKDSGYIKDYILEAGQVTFYF